MKRKLVLFISLIVCLLLAGCGNNTKITKSSDEYVGLNYDTVMQELQKAGFSDIETKEVQDLTSSSQMQDGEVGELSIDGNTSFEAKTSFAKDVKVEITYHTIKKIVCPLSAEEIQDHNYEDIEKMFLDSGFTNVSSSEIYDINPKVSGVDFTNEVLIDSASSFAKDEAIPFDAGIEVICHRPYVLYTVKMYIDFIPNLIFSKYDIKLLFGGETQYTLEHGEDTDYEFELREGDYTFTFQSAESSSVKGEISLSVASNIEVSYKISCLSDRVDVEEIYVDRDEKLEDNEAKVLLATSDYKYKNYKEAVDALKKAGFTNIKTEALYDISLGWTEEGEIESVSIGGVSEFKRGDVFVKDAEIIVTYHSNEDNDPSKIHPPYDTDTADGVDYEDVVQAFKDAGFTNISVEKRFETSYSEYGANTVANIYINERGTFDVNDAYTPDAEIRIDYYVISDSSDSDSGNGASSGKSSTTLQRSWAQIAFENYGELIYPSFKCHWMMDLRNAEQNSDGSWYFKVGVTFKNAYGTKIDTIAEGTVSGSDVSPTVSGFYISN